MKINYPMRDIRQLLFYVSVCNLVVFSLIVIGGGFHFRSSLMYGLLGMEVLYYGIPSVFWYRIAYLYYKNPSVYNQQCAVLKRKIFFRLLLSIIPLLLVAGLAVSFMLSMWSRGNLWLHGLCYYGPFILALGFIFAIEATRGDNLLIRLGCILMLGVAHDVLRDSYLRINDLRDYVAMIGSPILVFMITFLPDYPPSRETDDS